MPYSLGMIPTSLNEAKYSSWKCLKPIQLSEIGRWLANIPDRRTKILGVCHSWASVWGSSIGSFKGSPHTHPGFGHVYRPPCHPCAPNYIIYIYVNILGKFLAISCRTSHVFPCFASSGKLALITHSCWQVSKWYRYRLHSISFPCKAKTYKWESNQK